MSTPPPTLNNADYPPVYKYLVIDSGPIIKLSGTSSLWKRAHAFYTVPAVLEEIRDAKARQHLSQLPIMELKTMHPSSKSIQAVSDFAKQTGDYQSLSIVDIQVLALVYELEHQACHGDMSHIRTTPKRMVGLGPIKNLGNDNTQGSDGRVEEENEVDEEDISDSDTSSDEGEDDDDDDQHTEEAQHTASTEIESKRPLSWAKIANPNSTSNMNIAESNVLPLEDTNLHVPFVKMKLGSQDNDDNGQFSDAEDDPLVEVTNNSAPDDGAHALTIEQELELEFPSLSAAATVPQEGIDDETEVEQDNLLKQQLMQEEARKKEALKPISKSGKLYNSFTKYGDLIKPKQSAKQNKAYSEEPMDTKVQLDLNAPCGDGPFGIPQTDEKSRIIGGAAFAGQDGNVEDDGEGWISCTKDINTMKAAGVLDPTRNPDSVRNGLHSNKQLLGPPPNERAACATTDFAMQNVLLQMNLELLSVDGMKVRKLKSWVTRCGSCFKIYTSADNVGPLKSKRLFCSHCGSDFLQRIACSVDGKSGRLKLHLSKRHKNNLRGTKFSLPKPNTGNRFQGDLLLREDQMLVGAWAQKVKMRSGGKASGAAQSIFGKDIASNVGCHTSAMSSDDIRVGFGRRNPNEAKGRERRGKKKKTADKACGLRRY